MIVFIIERGFNVINKLEYWYCAFYIEIRLIVFAHYFYIWKYKMWIPQIIVVVSIQGEELSEGSKVCWQ